MTLEMHASIAESERGGRVERIGKADGGTGEPGSEFTHFFPRLGAMRRMLGAAGSAVYSCPRAGSRVGGRVALVFDDNGCGAGEVGPSSPVGRALLAHCERSALPAAWSAASDDRPFPLFGRRTVHRLKLPASVAGMAFPVCLGSVGNGLIVFEDASLDLDAGTVFAVHRMAYRLMADIFRAEISKATPKLSLSERELECLQWAGDGCKSEAIAERLGLSVHTVNAYLGTATAKLDSVNRIQAIAKAIRLGLIA